MANYKLKLTSDASSGLDPGDVAIWGDGDWDHGIAGTSSRDDAVIGISDIFAGVYGQTKSYAGVVGACYGNNFGVGVSGFSGNWAGVHGGTVGPPGSAGVIGANVSNNGCDGVQGRGFSGDGVAGESTNGQGVTGHSNSGLGVFGSSDCSDAVVGYKESANGIAGSFSNITFAASRFIRVIYNQAAAFWGNVEITGGLSVTGTKSFKIDHPLDPANKFLYHSAVESSEMKNVYDGVATLDANGRATVELPKWFQALNKAFRYQLTPIGKPAPGLHILEEISNNRFRIGGGIARMKVSWQVTGVRQDAWANAHPMPVEQRKSKEQQGRYLHPELYEKAKSKSIESVVTPELLKVLETAKQVQALRTKRTATAKAMRKFASLMKRRKSRRVRRVK